MLRGSDDSVMEIHDMKLLHYRLRFATPAFLGNAEQDGQWRTPPIKALLRQWWRVAYSAGQASPVNVAAMRTAEGRLFGVAADGEGDSRKSQIRIRLSRWDKGRMSTWSGQDSERVRHPEVKNPVGAQLYLGYGPLVFSQGQTALKARAAIQAGEDALLGLAFPSGLESARLDQALWLLHHYGTLGGRSRNGWGSFGLVPADADTPALDGALDEKLVADWQQALRADWPHALGRDTRGPLIWQTAALPDWSAVMRRLAETKIGLRTQFKFFPQVRPPHAKPLDRHWLSYPITNHGTSAWDRQARLPNSLRFKVRTERDGKLRGMIFHMPCMPPQKIFSPDLQVIERVWHRVHEFLDQAGPGLQRIGT